MKKRVFAIMMAVAMCLLWLPQKQVNAVMSNDGLWSIDRTEGKILHYYGDEEHLNIPRTIDGWSMKIIGGGAFAGNTNLKTVDLGSVKEIGDGAFSGCTNLVSIKGSASSVQVWDRAFKNCTSLEALDIVFSGYYVLNYPVIGFNTFENCTSLKEFTISEKIKEIEDQAFKGCSSLKTIYLHDDILKLGSGVFAGCTDLDGIWVSENNSRFANDEHGVLFNKDKSELVAAPGSLKGTYLVPETVKRLANEAFAGCANLQTILIPDTMTSMGSSCFKACTSLQTVVLPGGQFIDHRQFQGCTALETVVISLAFSNYAFADCTGLTSIYCLSGRTDHSGNAFQNVTANMYYLESKAKLPQDELQAYQFGGNLTWVPLDSYCVAKGDKSTYPVGSNIGAIFLIMADLDQLSSVSVDGRILTTDQYLAMTKGTSIILKDAYLSTLAFGTHTLEVQYADGSCTATFTLTEKCKHSIVTQSAVAPTCTKSGLTEGRYCSKCGEIFAEQETVKALGHSYSVTTVAPTCTKAGYDLHQCIRCSKTKQSDETAALGHSFGEWEIVKAPTTEEPGTQSRQCQNCPEIEEKQIDVLPPTQTEPGMTDPPITEPSAEPAPTEQDTTVPTEAKPAPTEPFTQDPEKQPNLVPWIIVGGVLLVITAVTALYLLRKKS